MEKDQEARLAQEPVGRLFAQLALPAVAAQVVNVLYNIVDRAFIGHISQVGALALTGVGVTTPVILMVSAFAALVSMGGAPRASYVLGTGDHEGAERIMGSCAATLVLISIVLTVGMIMFGEPLLLAFGASEETLPYALDYLRVYALGTVFEQLALGLSAFIAAQGFTAKSMQVVVVGCLVNACCDPVLIFLLGLGVQGAALSTIISQGISAAMTVAFLCSRKPLLRLRRDMLRIDVGLLGPCLALGASPCLMQITENAVAISFNIALLRYAGDIAVGSVTILTTIMNFTMLLIVGMTQGAQPILSYNLGTGNKERVRATFRLLLVCCVTGSMLIWGACMVVPGAIAGLFTDNAELIAYTTWSLRVFMSMLGIFGVQIACQYSLVALNQANLAIFLTIFRKILLLIPLIFILPLIVPDHALGVFLAEPIVDTIAVSVTSVLFRRRFKKLVG